MEVPEIGLVEVSAGGESSSLNGDALAMAASATITLRFLLSTKGGRSLEALRNARRSLLREEWTRGRGPEEPSLEDAVFSVKEILWVVRPDQRAWCLEKIEELRRRANLLLMEAEPS
jgi:hypothetical protein